LALLSYTAVLVTAVTETKGKRGSKGRRDQCGYPDTILGSCKMDVG
jgi:hypothetical protein